MATTTNEKPALTVEEIEKIKAEIADFKAKSIQYASSSPAMSAHYWRLFQASNPSMKRFDRMVRSAENRKAREERKAARENGSAPAPDNKKKAS